MLIRALHTLAFGCAMGFGSMGTGAWASDTWTAIGWFIASFAASGVCGALMEHARGIDTDSEGQS